MGSLFSCCHALNKKKLVHEQTQLQDSNSRTSSNSWNTNTYRLYIEDELSKNNNSNSCEDIV